MFDVSQEPFLIVGLGNPGPNYERTRHNAGVMALHELLSHARPMPASLSAHKKSNTLIAETRLGDAKVVMAQLRCYMNLSGAPVRQLADFFKIPPTKVIVLFDDLELDFGKIKIATTGGDHGHNGLRSITKALGAKDYVRASIGIGRPPGRMDVSSFVLKPFSKSEAQELPIICADMADEVERFVTTFER